MKCPGCGKVVFRNRETAQRGARILTAKLRDKKHPFRVYKGRWCRRWHITRTKTMLELLEKFRPEEVAS